MASPGEDGAMEVDEPCSEFTSTEDVKSEEKPESKDGQSQSYLYYNTFIKSDSPRTITHDLHKFSIIDMIFHIFKFCLENN
jgi:hypothetical protein